MHRAPLHSHLDTLPKKILNKYYGMIHKQDATGVRSLSALIQSSDQNVGGCV